MENALLYYVLLAILACVGLVFLIFIGFQVAEFLMDAYFIFMRKLDDWRLKRSEHSINK